MEEEQTKSSPYIKYKNKRNCLKQITCLVKGYKEDLLPMSHAYKVRVSELNWAINKVCKMKGNKASAPNGGQ